MARCRWLYSQKYVAIQLAFCLPVISGLFIVIDHISQFPKLFSQKFLAIQSAKKPEKPASIYSPTAYGYRAQLYSQIYLTIYLRAIQANISGYIAVQIHISGYVAMQLHISGYIGKRNIALNSLTPSSMLQKHILFSFSRAPCSFATL